MKKLAAALALALLGVVPAGVALAGPENEPGGCKNEKPQEKNPNCPEGQPPGHEKRAQREADAEVPPNYRFDSHRDLQGGGHSGRELPVHVQALEDNNRDGSFDDGNRILAVDGGQVLEVRGSRDHMWLTVTSAKADGDLSASEDGIHLEVGEQSLHLEKPEQ